MWHMCKSAQSRPSSQTEGPCQKETVNYWTGGLTHLARAIFEWTLCSVEAVAYAYLWEHPRSPSLLGFTARCVTVKQLVMGRHITHLYMTETKDGGHQDAYDFSSWDGTDSNHCPGSSSVKALWESSKEEATVKENLLNSPKGMWETPRSSGRGFFGLMRLGAVSGRQKTLHITTTSTPSPPWWQNHAVKMLHSSRPWKACKGRD